MTAMLTALRTLDARLDRGELTPEEYARRRNALLATADDAEGDFIDVTPAVTRGHARDAERPAATSAVGLGIVVVLVVIGVCMGFALILIDNMNLALTLGVTILAALCVALLRQTDP